MARGKRGLSEMVSYVLLIVIALGLAGGVYTWMKVYIPAGEEEKCSEDVSIVIKDYNCSETDKIISVVIENRGLFNIDGFFIKASKEANALPAILLRTTDVASDLAIDGRYDFDAALEPNQVKEAHFSYSNAIPLVKLRIQPYVTGKKNILSCENKITADIENCDGSEACTADCTGKECGDDGCGGTCGSCTEGESCSNGICTTTCTDTCASRGFSCGQQAICGATIDCGACAFPKPVCNAAGKCEESSRASLVGYWPFEGNANDASGNGNTPSAIGTGVTATASGKIGQAYNFDGTANSYIKILDGPSLSITGQGITLATWIKPSNTIYGDIIHKERHYSIVRYNTGGITYADSATWNYAAIGIYGNIANNQWNHVAVTFDGTNIKFYVNNVLVGTKARAGSITDTSSALFFGCYGSATACSSYYFNGAVDEVRIYNKALSQSEINEIYALS